MKYLVKSSASDRVVTLMIIENTMISVSDGGTLDQLFSFTSQEHAIANIQSMAQQLADAGMEVVR